MVGKFGFVLSAFQLFSLSAFLSRLAAESCPGRICGKPKLCMSGLAAR
jgi:hypothetical protein